MRDLLVIFKCVFFFKNKSWRKMKDPTTIIWDLDRLLLLYVL